MRKIICVKKNNWGFIKDQTYYSEKKESYISVRKNSNDVVGRLFSPEFFNEVFKDLQEYKDTHYNILAYKVKVRQRVERIRKLRKINASKI